MEEILHQMICSLSHDLQGFIHPWWCRISSINSSNIPLSIYQDLFSLLSSTCHQQKPAAPLSVRNPSSGQSGYRSWGVGSVTYCIFFPWKPLNCLKFIKIPRPSNMALVWINISGNGLKNVNMSIFSSKSLNSWKSKPNPILFEFFRGLALLSGPFAALGYMWGSCRPTPSATLGLKGWLCLSNHAPNNKRHLAWMSRLLLEGSKDLLHHRWWGVS